MRFGTHQNRGSSLEAIVIASQGSTVCLDKFNAEIKFLGKRQGGGTAARKGKVDFCGTVVGTGRALFLDCKQTEHPHGFRLYEYLAPHQEEFLNRHGRAGALAGVLVEGTHPDVAAYFWIDWRVLSRYWSRGWNGSGGGNYILWSEMVRLGDNKFNIRWDAIIRGSDERTAA